MGGELRRDDDAVSPVVGVTLLIGITVVLAATTATFAFGLGERADNRVPQADFTYEYSQVGNGNLTLIYESGDTLDPSNIEVRTDVPFRPAPGNNSGTLRNSGVESYALNGEADGGDWVGSEIKAGSEFTIVGQSSNLKGGIVRIVWVDPSGGRTAILGDWQGPNA